ncbi:MAG: hypothetical protein AABZ12_14765 [Planctomycetota bacterium]
MNKSAFRKMMRVIAGLACVLAMATAPIGCAKPCGGNCDKPCKKADGQPCPPGCTKPCCKKAEANKPCPAGCTKPCCKKT